MAINMSVVKPGYANSVTRSDVLGSSVEIDQRCYKASNGTRDVRLVTGSRSDLYGRE